MVNMQRVVSIREFGREMNKILNQIKKEIIKDKRLADIYSQRLANFSARSYRARVSNAPYNYRSDKAGQWSRGGGVPLEKSVFVKRTKDGYSVGIKKSGNSKLKGAIAPTVYYKFGAIKYLHDTTASLHMNKNKLLQDILINKKR